MVKKTGRITLLSPFAHPTLVLAFRCRAFSGEIHDAARSGELEKVQELLDKDPSLVSGRDDLSRTAPHYAAAHGHRGVAQLLLAKKAEVDARDGFGGTPLYVAAVNGNRDVAKSLLASKADVNAKTNRGPAPPWCQIWASGYTQGEVLTYFLDNL